MADVTRKIGLSLGGDLCWPICYAEIMKTLDLALPVGGDTVRFEVETVSIEPYDLQQDCPYDLVIDRLTHWYHTSREWIKKSVLMDGLYVYNNPWSLQSMEKQTSYCAMMRLGMPVPKTWMVPPKSYDEHADLDVTLKRYARMFDLGEIGDKVGYPLFMKPYDGGAWKGVSRIDDAETLRAKYEESGKLVMHLQRSVDGFDRFVRCVGIGPQFRLISYDPGAPLHDRYEMKEQFVDAEEKSLLEDMTMTINSFFGWDFNSCEALHKDGVWHPIDFANACPDSQVTSLHFFFPWLVMANIRWSTFCAATGKTMRQNLEWEPYFRIAREDLPYREKLRRYAAIGHERMETERFREFCDKHLPHLGEQAHAFFATEKAKETIRRKVAVLFPEHEIEEFTELFWGRIQKWRDTHPDGEY